jgi:hypothetical protein
MKTPVGDTPHTIENCGKLAEVLVTTMPFGQLEQMVIDQYTKLFTKHPDRFHEVMKALEEA